ncbi:DUF3291 domain-containing protein [Oceanicoccus sagamiensis]|uniref:DUF3291 domain-containing protein n=1 Tax=Oceanicoccus sagamiensis TaxID=716816 RepID=A0A1X9NAB3_9GAMM|nr:DUF3291 domain-containing protein [Oceanicoccus sagamiensis]ARN73372.1 hypothetical protein BST96_04155 [Oceanicoccus sagamiensis]
MSYQLAQFNIAQFLLPMEHPNNADFINNIDRVNGAAESQPGFIWRLVGDGGVDNALEVKAYEDNHTAVNMSVWQDQQSLEEFVFRSEGHLSIMRRRREWFDKMEFYSVLWWVKAGHQPTVVEAKERLEQLRDNGPTVNAFTFRSSFPAPD